MTMGSAPKANKGRIEIEWAEVFRSTGDGNGAGSGDDDAGVYVFSSPSAAGKGKAKGNSFARSSPGFRDDEGFISPPPPAVKGKGKGKGRRDEDAEAELSPRSNDGLRRDIENMSDSELQCEIQNACSTHPSFGGLLEQEKRDRRERLLPLLKAEARYRGIDRDAAKVRDYRNRDDSSDAKRFCMFDFDDLEEEQVPSKFIRRSSPIRSTKKKHYGTLGVVTRQRVPIPVDKMYASKTSPTTLYSHKQRVRAVDPKEHDNEKHQQIGNSHHSNYTMRRKERQGVSSLSLSRKGNNVVLLDDEDVQPDESVHCGVPDKWRKSKIYYPSRDDPEAVELNGSDFRCLDPGVYLSSPVINYYIQRIKRTKLCSEDDRDKFYMFSTYFYNKLREALFGKGDFLKLRRWWKGINIFQRGYIILPIHGTAHWSLVIICIPAKESNSGPIILHLDSLGMHPSDEIFDTVKRYLVEEWHHLRKNPPAISISEKIWDDLPMNIHKEIVEVPAQNNAYDCGIFMLYYIKQFIKDAPERFTRNNIAMFSRSWFRSEVVSGFRNRIRELLLKEFENAGVDDVMLEAPTSDGSDAECIIKEGESEAVTPCGSPEMGADAVMLEAATSDCFDEECIGRKGKLEAATACDSLEMFGGGGDTMEGTSYVMTGECVLSEEATLSGSVKDDKDTMKADSHSSGSEDVEILPSDRSKNNEEVRHRAPDVDILCCCDSDAVDTGVETNNEDVTRRAHSSGSEEDVEILPSDRSKNNEEVRHRAPDVEILCCDDSCDSDADDTAAEMNNEDVMRRAAGVGALYCEDSCDSDTEGPAAARKWRSKNNKEAMEVEKGGGGLDLCQIS